MKFDFINKPWYAIHLGIRNHPSVEVAIREKGYDLFAPSYRASHGRARAMKIDRPLFPGYLFCSLDWNNSTERLGVLKIPGVIGILGSGSAPTQIAQNEMEAVHRLLESGLSLEPWRRVSVGDRVVVESGPLKGLEGIVAVEKGKSRLIVHVATLNRSLAVEVDRDMLQRSTPINMRPMHGRGTDRGFSGAGSHTALRPTIDERRPGRLVQTV